MQSCDALAPYCGDGQVTSTEHCDTADQLPYANVDCAADTCLYDFSAVPQIYCYGTCSWGGIHGCDQYEADLLCKLRTGDATSVALDFDLAYTLHAPGFSCPNVGVNLGGLPELGVAQTVWYQDFDLVQTHGNGVVIVNPTCT